MQMATVPVRMSREDRTAFQRQERRRKLIAAGVAEAAAVGFVNMTRNGIAARAGLANGSVNHEFGSMDGLREAVMREAVTSGQVAIVAQGLACGHPVAKEAPEGVRAEAARTLI